jgi:histone-lysine N-methyltransferase MLL3
LKVFQVNKLFILANDFFKYSFDIFLNYYHKYISGIESLTDYRFKYGRNPLLELPLAVNPTGCARSEGRPKGHWKRAHTQRTCSVSLRPSFAPSTPLSGEAACPYSKQFVHSKSSQYKKMKQEWRNNVYLARYYKSCTNF